MPKELGIAPQNVPGEDKTSYVSKGKEISDFYKGSTPKAPSVSAKTDDSKFINAALFLTNHMGMTFQEAVVALLAAKSNNPAFAYGALKFSGGKVNEAVDSLTRNLELIEDAYKHSLENRLKRVCEAIGGVKEAFEESEEGFIIPLATLKNHALVMNSKGAMFRIGIEESEDGTICVTKTEKITDGNPPPVEDAVKSAVEALCEGKKAQIKVHLADLLKHSVTNDVNFNEARYKHVLQQVKTESFWKNHIKENTAKVRAFVRGNLHHVNKSGVRPRFQKLSLSEMDDTLAGQYKPKVRDALGNLMDRLTKMKEEISEAFHGNQWLINSLASYDQKQGAQTSNFLNCFVGDLINSLTSTTDGIKLAVSEDDLPFQALLHDTLAEEYPNYALAYLFVQKALSDIKSGV